MPVDFYFMHDLSPFGRRQAIAGTLSHRSLVGALGIR